MPHAFSEDVLVEQPAIELFAGLGWQTIGAFDEVFVVDDLERGRRVSQSWMADRGRRDSP